MKILSIDTCGNYCSVGLFSGDSFLYKSEIMQRGQDARIMPMIREVMGKTDFASINMIAVAKGPGSFTGTRIGIAVAQGIGFGLSKPVIGIDRFETYKKLCGHDDVIVVLDSMRKELFFCEYKKGHERNIQMLSLEETEKLVDGKTVVGDVKNYKGFSAKDILEMNAKIALEANTNNEQYKPIPLYVREPDVT